MYILFQHLGSAFGSTDGGASTVMMSNDLSRLGVNYIHYLREEQMTSESWAKLDSGWFETPIE